jgi:hypothetical protein
MKGFRQTSGAKRIAVGVLALYALLLQAFFASATPLQSFDSSTGIICAQSAGTSPGSGAPQHAHHGSCCILSCSSTASVVVDTASDVVYFPAREPSRFEFATASAFALRTAFKFYFAARGPLQDL